MTKVDCSKVFVDISSFSTPDNKFDGAFAKVDIKKGELVEKGLVHRLSDNKNKVFDGMKNPYVFTWSNDIPNHTWASASGCAPFYNSGLDTQTNTCMDRYFSEDRFEIYATKSIKAGDELTHPYKSLTWRDVFIPLYNELITDTTIPKPVNPINSPIYLMSPDMHTQLSYVNGFNKLNGATYQDYIVINTKHILDDTGKNRIINSLTTEEALAVLSELGISYTPDYHV
jgi:hypothetical protein